MDRTLLGALAVVACLLVLCIVKCCSHLSKSEAVQVEAPAAALTAPQSRDHRTYPPVTRKFGPKFSLHLRPRRNLGL